jgi:GH43 family beta-xylosidase
MKKEGLSLDVDSAVATALSYCCCSGLLRITDLSDSTAIYHWEHNNAAVFQAWKNNVIPLLCVVCV